MGPGAHCRPRPHQRPPARHPVWEGRGKRARVGAGANDRVGRGPVRLCTHAPLNSKLKKNVTGQETAGNTFFLLLNKGPCVFIWHRGLQITQPAKPGPRGPPGSGGNAPLRGWGHGGPHSDQCSEKVRGRWEWGAPRRPGRRVPGPGRGSEWPQQPLAVWRSHAVLDGRRFAGPWVSGGHPRDPEPSEGREKGHSPQQHRTGECAPAPAPADARKTVSGGERVTVLVRRAGRGLHSLLYIFHVPCAGIAIPIRKITPRMRGGASDRSHTHSPVHRPALAPSADSARHPVPPSRGPATCAPS